MVMLNFNNFLGIYCGGVIYIFLCVMCGGVQVWFLSGGLVVFVNIVLFVILGVMMLGSMFISMGGMFMGSLMFVVLICWQVLIDSGVIWVVVVILINVLIFVILVGMVVGM